MKKFGIFGCNPTDTSILWIKNWRKKTEKGKLMLHTMVIYFTSLTQDSISCLQLIYFLDSWMIYPSHIPRCSNTGAKIHSMHFEYEIKYNSKVEAKLVAFCDNEWAVCMNDMKNTSGVFYFFIRFRCIFIVFKESNKLCLNLSQKLNIFQLA